MRAVFKYKLQLTKYQSVSIPIGGKILCLDAESNEPCMWVEVDMNEQVRVDISIEIYCTGESFWPENKEYLGTFQIQGDAYIYHAYKTKL